MTQKTNDAKTGADGDVAIADLFGKPIPVTDSEIAFGGDMQKLLPGYKAIPEEFRRGRGKWNDVVSRWFFTGLPEDTEWEPAEGIDGNTALRHVAAIMKSWAPKHEHKEAGCAYLLSKWFTDVSFPNVKRSR